ncbi:uncharacterized protein ISCGN_031396 [Ixodes scapularis]
MTSEEYKYAVVEFIEDNEEVTVAPVPLSWFNVKTNQCVWPSNMSGVDILSRVQAGQAPDPGWPSFRGSILRKCKTFRKAKKRTTIAERLSCVESTDAGEPDEEPASTSGGTRRPPSGEETSVVLPTPLQAPKRKKPRRQHPESLTSEHRPLETGGTGESTGVPKDTATHLQQGSAWLCVPLSSGGRKRGLHRNCHHHSLKTYSRALPGSASLCPVVVGSETCSVIAITIV